MQLEHFIEESNACDTADQLLDVFEKALQTFGIDKFIYCIARGNIVSNQRSQHGVVKNYPEDWVKHYASRNYIRSDPTYRYGLSRRGFFTWKELESKVPYSKNEMAVMGEAEDAGLKSGITISIHGPCGEVIGIGLASSCSKNDIGKNQLHALYALCNQFHLVYSGMADTPVAATVSLTDKQREVLRWAATGKSRGVISEIMAISEDTVDDHFRQIFKKLGCNDRIVAVLKAIDLGLIRV